MLRFTLPALVALVLTLACNGDDNGAAGPTATNPPPTPTPTIDSGAIDSRPGSTAPVGVRPVPDPPAGIATQTAIRIGLHTEAGGWDRIVFEFDRSLPQADISYVEAIAGCASGEPVAVQGDAILSVRMLAQAHDDAGASTIASRVLPGQGGIILQARLYCDFEGHLDWAIGLKDEKPFKVTTLSNPPRLVIDIKQ